VGRGPGHRRSTLLGHQESHRGCQLRGSRGSTESPPFFPRLSFDLHRPHDRLLEPNPFRKANLPGDRKETRPTPRGDPNRLSFLVFVFALFHFVFIFPQLFLSPTAIVLTPRGLQDALVPSFVMHPAVVPHLHCSCSTSLPNEPQKPKKP